MNFLTLEKSYHLRVIVVPLKPKFQYFQVDHLLELDHADEDDNVLPQASHFKDRVFLNEITERKHVLDLLTGDISPGQFSILPDMSIENGKMLKHLANDLDTRFQGEIPKVYHRFIKKYLEAYKNMYEIVKYIQKMVKNSFIPPATTTLV